MTHLPLRLRRCAGLVALALLAGASAAQQAPPAAEPGATPPADAGPPSDAKAEPSPADAGLETPKASPAKPAAAKGSPQRFEPTEKVRPDFDVAFPVDI